MRLSRAFRHTSLKCFHIDIVGQQEAVETDPLADDLTNNERRERGRPFRIPGSEQQMPGHADWRSTQSLERCQIGFQLFLACRDSRQFVMRVCRGPPVAGHMLDTAGDAA